MRRPRGPLLGRTDRPTRRRGLRWVRERISAASSGLCHSVLCGSSFNSLRVLKVNYVTSTVVRDLGFLYLASTLLQSGLYDTNRKGGLWLGADYWGSAWRGALGKGAAQSATAGSSAAFLTLMVQNRLVSPRASEEMRGLLQKVPNMASPGTGSWFWQSLIRLPNGGSLEVLLSKVGLSGGADECAFIKRAVVDKDGKPVVDKDGNPIVLRYVAVGLRAKKGNELESLILELDRCILANNGLTAAQGGHP